jgi:hypothetical protein
MELSDVAIGEYSMKVDLSVFSSKPVVNSGVSGHQQLEIEELLILVMLANRHGYTVKAACEMKPPCNEISTDLYSVWFAIENDIPIFADNIPSLIQFTGWEHSQLVDHTHLKANEDINTKPRPLQGAPHGNILSMKFRNLSRRALRQW